MRRRGFRILALVVAGLAAVGVALWAVWPPPPPAPDWAAEYDVNARPPEVIPPGTVIPDTAPDGWSHLVLKSRPRVRPNELPRLKTLTLDADLTARMAAWMFTAFLADVRPDDRGGFRFRAIGLGLGTNADGRDTVVTADTTARFGVRTDWISREILTKGYKIQGDALMPVHGPTFALLDAPVLVHRGGKTRNVRYRYALLVDGTTGRLDVLLWTLEPETGEPTLAVRIEPDTLDDAELVPDPAQFTLGIPTEFGFGVEKLPPHRDRFTLPPDLRPPAARTKFTPTDALALETGLRRLAAGPPSP